MIHSRKTHRHVAKIGPGNAANVDAAADVVNEAEVQAGERRDRAGRSVTLPPAIMHWQQPLTHRSHRRKRKSVVEGRGVTVRVYIGGWRSMQQNNINQEKI